MIRKENFLKKAWAVTLALGIAMGTLVSPLTAQAANVRVPAASGTTTYENGKVLVDASNVSQGYVMIRYSGGKERIKVQITKGGVTYTYDLNARDAYEVFPFSEGNGTYSVKV